MHFNFLIYSSFPRYSGGRETWLYNITLRLLEREHAVRIYSYRNHNLSLFHEMPAHPNLKIIEIPVLVSIPKFGPKIVRSYVNILNMLLWVVFAFFLILIRRKGNTELFVGLGAGLDSMPIVMLKRLFPNLSYICSVRGPHARNSTLRFPRLMRFFFYMEGLTVRKADLVAANGYDTAKYLERYDIRPVLFPNGADISTFGNSIVTYPRPDFFPLNGGYIITMTASLMPYRGIDTAILGAKRLKEIGNRQFRLLFVGKGSQKQWKEYARELEVSDRIIFAGERSDIAAILANSDVILAFCQEFHGGGFSMALLEAMAAGKAIVAWDNNYYRQLITNDVNGLLIPESDQEALAKALLRLLNDSELRMKLGDAAKQKAKEYDWEAVTNSVEALSQTLFRERQSL